MFKPGQESGPIKVPPVNQSTGYNFDGDNDAPPTPEDYGGVDPSSSKGWELNQRGYTWGADSGEWRSKPNESGTYRRYDPTTGRVSHVSRLQGGGGYVGRPQPRTPLALNGPTPAAGGQSPLDAAPAALFQNPQERRNFFERDPVGTLRAFAPESGGALQTRTLMGSLDKIYSQYLNGLMQQVASGSVPQGGIIDFIEGGEEYDQPFDWRQWFFENNPGLTAQSEAAYRPSGRFLY